MWKKLKEKKSKAASALGNKLNLYITTKQRKWADYLQRKTMNVSDRKKKVCLILFCLLSLGACTLIIIQALFEKQPESAIIKVQPLPKLIREKEEERSWLSREDSMSIIAFRYTLDSMNRSAEGRAALQKYFQDRPGLLDSFITLENLIKQH